MEEEAGCSQIPFQFASYVHMVLADSFIQPRHSQQLYDAYSGAKDRLLNQLIQSWQFDNL